MRQEFRHAGGSDADLRIQPGTRPLLEGEARGAGKDGAGALRSRGVRLRRHVGRIFEGLRIVLAGAGEKDGGVAVLEPAALGIQHLRQFGQAVQALPLGGGIAAIQGLGPVEIRVAARDGIAVKVINIAGAIGVDGVGPGEREAPQRSLKFAETARPGHGPALLHDTAFDGRRAYRQARVAAHTEDGTVVRFAEYHAARFDAGGSLHADVVHPLDGLPVGAGVAVGKAVVGVVELLQVDVGGLGVVVGVAPAEASVVAGTDIGGSEDGEAGNVEAFAAVQVGFIALSCAEESDVRIDEQQGVSGGGAARADGPHIGTFVGVGGHVDGAGAGQSGEGAFALGARDSGAGGSAMFLGEDEPGLPMGEQARMDGRVPGEVVVDAGRKGIAQSAEFGAGVGVVIAGALLGFVGARHDVGGEGGGAVDFGGAAQGVEVIFFELPEVVLGLGVHESEDGVGIRFAVDVGDAVGVAIDGDGRLRGGGGDGGEEEEGEGGKRTGREACPTWRPRHG